MNIITFSNRSIRVRIFTVVTLLSLLATLLPTNFSFAAAPVVLFEEDFEANDGFANWTTVGSAWSNVGASAGDTGRKARLTGSSLGIDGQLDVHIPTTGYENIKVSLSYKGEITNESDFANVTFFNGADSIGINVFNQSNSSDGTWRTLTNASLNSTADDNADFAIQFNGNLTAQARILDIDNIVITGEPIEAAPQPSLELAFTLDVVTPADYTVEDLFVPLMGSGSREEIDFAHLDLFGDIYSGAQCEDLIVSETDTAFEFDLTSGVEDVFTYTGAYNLPADLLPGTYSILLALWNSDSSQHLLSSECRVFEVVAEDENNNEGANGGGGSEMVTICHATASEQNPYEVQTVNSNAITNPGGHGNSGVNAGDIIPPFGEYPGQNWTTENQVIWENECEVPPGEEAIFVPLTVCKYDQFENRLSGWDITVTNGDVEYNLTTSEVQDVQYDIEATTEGCAVINLDVLNGPWYVLEEEREGWEQLEVTAEGPESQVVEAQRSENDFEACYFGVPAPVLQSFSETPQLVQVVQPTWTCSFMNQPVVADSQCIGLNLIENGSFEDPVVTNATLWQKFASVLGWAIDKVSDDTSTTLELHRGWSGNQAADGLQYAELDGDHATIVSQAVTTLPGAVYELSWAFAPRHAIAAAHNQLSVLVDGVEVATEGPAVGVAGLTADDWTVNATTFTATAISTEVAFADAGVSDTFGTFLDDVTLCLVREPEPLDLCPNIDGLQTSIPEGYEINEANHCVPTDNEPTPTQCVVPNTLGDNTPFVLLDSGEKTIAAMFAEHGYGFVDTITDQMNYQVWDIVDPTADTVTFNVRVLGKRAGNTQVLGYYKAGDGTTFTTLLTQAADTDGEAPIPVTIPAAFADSFGFAIISDDNTWYSEIALNSDGEDHVAVYQPTPNTYLLAFEDFNNLGDGDYNDLLIEVSEVTCTTIETTPNGDGGNGSPVSRSGGGSSRSGNADSSENETQPEPTVAGASTSVVSPTPLVLGDQVSAVPYGAPATGHGGASTTSGVTFTITQLLFGTRRTMSVQKV